MIIGDVNLTSKFYNGIMFFINNNENKNNELTVSHYLHIITITSPFLNLQSTNCLTIGCSIIINESIRTLLELCVLNPKWLKEEIPWIVSEEKINWWETRLFWNAGRISPTEIMDGRWCLHGGFPSICRSWTIKRREHSIWEIFGAQWFSF